MTMCPFTKNGKHVATKFLGKLYLYHGMRVCQHCGTPYRTPQ